MLISVLTAKYCLVSPIELISFKVFEMMIPALIASHGTDTDFTIIYTKSPKAFNLNKLQQPLGPLQLLGWDLRDNTTKWLMILSSPVKNRSQ